MFYLFFNIAVVHVCQSNCLLAAQLACDKVVVLLGEATLVFYRFALLDLLAVFAFEVSDCFQKFSKPLHVFMTVLLVQTATQSRKQVRAKHMHFV